MGPEEPAARAVEPLQRPPPQGRAHPGVPALATGPSSTSGSTSPSEGIELPSIYFAHQRRGVPARRHAAGGQRRSSRSIDGEEVVEAHGALPHRRRRDVHRRGRVVGGDRRRGHRRGRRHPHHRAGRHPRRRPHHRGRHGRPQEARGTSDGELLRFATAGSVDDGKSTLIGRLLYDSKAIFEDQLEAVERTSAASGATSTPNLALLTDGLRAEREQGITIDVAYRYFATPQRKFIIADTPGPHPVHAQHGHRRVHRRPGAGAGRRPQGRRSSSRRRHAFLASLLRHPAPRAVRQQDGPRRLRPGRASSEIKDEFRELRHASSTSPTSRSSRLGAARRQRRRPLGRTCRGTRARRCCTTSRRCTSPRDRNLIDARFPVQYVHPAHAATSYHDYRGYAGTVAGGVFKPGRRGRRAAVGLHVDDRVDRHRRRPGRRGVRRRCRSRIRLADDIDVSPRRHDLPARTTSPHVGQDIDAMVCWIDEQSTLRPGAKLRDQAHDPLGAGAGQGPALPARRQHAAPRRVAPTTLRAQRDRPGHACARTSPLFFDEYRRNRTTGSFILIDEATNATVGAGMILGPEP